MTPTEQPPVQTQELKGRYLAEQMVEHPEREDCYIARLLVKEVSPKDSRPYFLDVENAHGTDRYAVKLTVKGKERNRPTRESCPCQSLSEISCLYPSASLRRSGVDGIRDWSGHRVTAPLRHHGRRPPLRVQEAENVL